MNKKQLFCMWLGIAIMLVCWWYAPREFSTYLSPRHELYRTIIHILVQPDKLYAQWVLVGAITGGLIFTFKTKQQGDKQDATKEQEDVK